MATFTGYEYCLLALCKSPLLIIPHDLARNIRSISALEPALTANLPDWKMFLEEGESDIESGPNDAYGLTSCILECSTIPQSAEQAIANSGTDSSALMTLYKEWAQKQRRLKTEFLSEIASIGQEDEQAARRKEDLTPIIYKSIKALAEKGLLKELVAGRHAHSLP